MLGSMWCPTGKFLAFWQLVSFPTTLFWGLFVKAWFQALSFKMSNPPPDYLSDWLDKVTKDCHMHRLWEWFYTHSTVYFSPIKNKLVSVANWRPSYAWAVETVTAVHTSSPVSFVTHHRETITVFDTHAGILLQLFCFLCHPWLSQSCNTF